MTAFTAGGLVLVLALGACLVGCTRGAPPERLVALEAATAIAPLALLLLGLGAGRDVLLDPALALAFLGLPGGLVFVRFLERWI